MPKYVDFYVGILKEDEDKLIGFTHLLNEDSDQSYHVYVVKSWDNPQGYFTYHLRGSFKAYKCFSSEKFTKSIEHFEED